MINLIVYLLNATFLSKTLLFKILSLNFTFPLVCHILLSYCWSQELFKGSFCRCTFLHPTSLSGVGADLSTDKGGCLLSFPFACLPKKWLNFSQFEFYWESEKDIPFPEPVTVAIMVIVGSGYFSPFELNVLISIVCERHSFCFHCDAVKHRHQTLILDWGHLRAVSVVHLVKKAPIIPDKSFYFPMPFYLLCLYRYLSFLCQELSHSVSYIVPSTMRYQSSLCLLVWL